MNGLNHEQRIRANQVMTDGVEGGGGMQGREAVTPVLNYCEQSMMSWRWFIDELMEECIIFRAKTDTSWKDKDLLVIAGPKMQIMLFWALKIHDTVQ